MPSNRKEYLKEYTKKNYAKLRKYRTAWMRQKRLSQYPSWKFDTTPPPKEAKKRCIICSQELIMNAKRYKLFGNFCLACSNLKKLEDTVKDLEEKIQKGAAISPPLLS